MTTQIKTLNNYRQPFKKKKWQNEWLNMSNKLNEIKRTTEKWNDSNTLNRRDKVVLNF